MERLQDFILLFKISMGTCKNFFEICPSHVLGGYDGEVGYSPFSIPLVDASNTS
jgi:hypothetical protein